MEAVHSRNRSSQTTGNVAYKIDTYHALRGLGLGLEEQLILGHFLSQQKISPFFRQAEAPRMTQVQSGV
jgi:hypothetical protein